MLITRLVLHKSKRLGFNGIETMTYTPRHLYQIILGTNGSGKSSLIGELSPLPASGLDYFKGGYKLIELTHNNKHFELLSDFSSKKAGHHSFLLDAVEMNEGGTSTVQKQLVKEYFNIDKELFDLLSSQSNFREFSANTRRQWLIRMADDNMEYAINLYNEVNKRLRDTGSVVKYLDEQITTVSKQNPDIDNKEQELQERERTLKLAHRTLSQLDSVDTTCDMDELRGRIKKGFEVLTTLSNSVLELETIKGFKLKSPNQIGYHISTLQSKIADNDKDINYLTAEYNRVNQAVNALINQASDDVGSLENKLFEVQDKQREYLSHIHKFKSILDYDAKLLSESADRVEEVLNTILSDIPDNTNKFYNREHMNQASHKREVLANSIAQLDNKLRTYQHTIDHLENTDKTVCPKCNHSFLPGMNQYTLSDMIKLREGINNQKEELLAELQIGDNYLQEVHSYMSQYRQLREIINHNPNLNPLWQVFDEHPLTEYSPNKYLSLYSHFVREVGYYLESTKLQSSIDEMTVAISSVKSTTGTHQEYNKTVIEDLQKRIEHLVLSNHKLQEEIDEYRNYETLYQRAVKLESQLTDTDSKLAGLIESYYKAGVNHFISLEIDEVNRQLGSVAFELSNITTIKHRLIDLKNQRDEKAALKNSLELLSKQLSPVNGLIAEYSLKFITQFTDQMNAIINSVWTYDMQLQPLAISEDLTYKFPVYMSESDTQTPDIDKLSSAQKRIVDFAFKILLITYLELENYPLYIDELTPNLDETHRINITNYLKTFVDSGRCSQMFMTSHYVSGQNAFRDAEFVVINQSNLLNIPDEFNKEVEYIFEGASS